ncbi:MAG: segregation/condensation protein A [Gammaproteobacteria bacterium]|nr:segregation/condensation protein A [Gammaproteobacteria bacterium]
MSDNKNDIEENPSSEPSPSELSLGEGQTESPVLVNGEKLEKWPLDLYIPPDALEVFLETFQGPLDLLLYLIRKQNIDILNIPVAHITQQYMEYVELMRQFRLDLAAEYLVMAATLAEVKSRMLLPRPAAQEEEEEEDPRAALVRRLQEYERFNQAAMDMDKRPRIEREIYLANLEFDDPSPRKVEARASLNDLVNAFRSMLERTQNNKNWAIGEDTLTVREKMTHILDRLNQTGFVRFEDLFVEEEGRRGMVVSFMAILELAKDNMLLVVQNEPFAPIHVKGVE